MKPEEKDFENPDAGKKQALQYGKKGRRPRRGNVRREVNLDEITTNDIRYWNKTQGFDNVTKFPWNLIVGYPRQIINTIDNSDVNYADLRYTTLNPDCIMAIDCIMGPGWASDTNDGVNRGLAQTMATIRSNLSTANIGFETADLGIYLTSTSSIAYTIGYAKKILECRSVWKDRNIAYPKALIKALGCDYMDIISNYNRYASELNSIIDRYNNMRIPDFSDCYDRQYSMMHNVFCDEDSDLGQLYVFRPKNFYVYDDTSTPSKAKFLEFADWNDRVGFEGIISILNNMLDSWYGSSDMYQINGTLLRAFKDAPIQNMPYFEQDMSINPVQDRAFLMQIMNCNIISNVDMSVGALDITQNPEQQNYIIWKPSVLRTSSDVRPSKTSHVLRIFEDDSNADDNMEMTRLLNLYETGPDPESPEILSSHIRNCGSEIVCKIETYKYDAINDSVDSTIFLSNNIIIDTTSTASLLLAARRIASISPFRYIPCFNTIWDSDGISVYTGIIGDMYNWMIYDKKDWDLLQFNAYWSLWKPNI